MNDTRIRAFYASGLPNIESKESIIQGGIILMIVERICEVLDGRPGGAKLKALRSGQSLFSDIS
jgi:hypothetical protein